MLHDGWFWLAAVETLIILAVIAVVVWALKSPPRGPRVDREACKPEHFIIEARIGQRDGEVHIDYDRRVTSVTVSPAAAHDMANKIHAAADVVEKSSSEDHEQLPTAWDRISGGGRL